VRPKTLLAILLLIPVIYLLFVLNYFPSTFISFKQLDHFFGTNTFEGKNDAKNLFNFNQIVYYDYKIPILMYHYVEYNQNKEDFKRDQLNIEPHIFEQQIQTLINNNYEFITANELATIIESTKPNPKNYVVLTFDDGYRDFYTDVLPILKKYNAKATIYLVYNFLDNPNYLYTWQVNEIIDSKLVEIGSHTLNHTYLKGMTEEIIVNEINGSKFELENAFNIKINSFAYPYGAYNELTAKLVELAGYTNAVTTDLGIISNTNNKFVLKRIRPGYSTEQGLINYLEKLKEN